jgi:hypothetical protein
MAKEFDNNNDAVREELQRIIDEGKEIMVVTPSESGILWAKDGTKFTPVLRR